MRKLLVALVACLAALSLAPAAEAAHQTYIPEGAIVVKVLFVSTVVPAPSPVPATDDAYAGACAATQGLPASCTYLPPVCEPTVLVVFCRLPP